MLNYNSVIKKEIKQESISVKEISPVMKINLRGKKREFLTNVGKNLNIILPTEANTSTTSDKLTAIWLSPDEWMIVSNDLVSKDNNKFELYENLFNIPNYQIDTANFNHYLHGDICTEFEKNFCELHGIISIDLNNNKSKDNISSSIFSIPIYYNIIIL